MLKKMINSETWNRCTSEEAGIHFGVPGNPLKLSSEHEITQLGAGYRPATDLQAVVVDHQPEIAAFFKTRDFTKAKENECRAVIVEFLKYCALNKG